MDGAALLKGERLKSSREVQIPFQDGIRFHGEKLSILVRRRDEGGPRVAFVATKKLGNAVRRNRAKRLLREAYRKSRNRIFENVDIIFIAKESILRSDCNSVESEVSRLLQRARGTGRWSRLQ